MLEKSISLIVPIYKTCSKCGETKTEDLFRKHKKICKACKSLYDIRYRELNKEKLTQQKKEYSLKNKETKRVYDIEYRRKNLKKLNKQRLEKYHTDINFKIRHTYRNRLNSALRDQNTKKNKSSLAFLGCSIEQVRKHLESQFQEGMTWENHATDGWHIDHIIPCISFDLTKEEEIKKCFHYTNLKPLWAEENLSKSDKIINSSPQYTYIVSTD